MPALNDADSVPPAKGDGPVWPAIAAGLVWVIGWIGYLISQPLHLDSGGIAGLVACLAGVPALGWLAWSHHRRTRLLYRQTEALMSHLEQFGQAGDDLGGRANLLARALERRTRDYLEAGAKLTGLTDRISDQMAREQNALEGLSNNIDRQGREVTAALSRQVAEMTHATETANNLVRTHTGGFERLVTKLTADTRHLTEDLDRRVTLLSVAGERSQTQMAQLGAQIDQQLERLDRTADITGKRIDGALTALEQGRQAVTDQVAVLSETESRALDWIRQISSSVLDQRDVLAEGAKSIATQAERSRTLMGQLADDLVDRVARINDAANAAAQAIDGAGAALDRQALHLSETGTDASMLLTSFGDSFADQAGRIGQAVDAAEAHMQRLADHLPATASALADQAGLVQRAIAQATDLGEQLRAGLAAQTEALDQGGRLIGQRIDENRNLMNAQAAELVRLMAQMSEAGGQIAETGRSLHQTADAAGEATARARAHLGETVASIAQAADQGGDAARRQAAQMADLFAVLTRGTQELAQLSDRSREGLVALGHDTAAALHTLDNGSQMAADRMLAAVTSLEERTRAGQDLLTALGEQQAGLAERLADYARSLGASEAAIARHATDLASRSGQADTALAQLTSRMQDSLTLLGDAEHQMAGAADRLGDVARQTLTRIAEGKGAIDQAGNQLQQQGERTAGLLTGLGEQWLSLTDWAEQSREALEHWGRTVQGLEQQIDQAIGRIDQAAGQLGDHQQRIDDHLQDTTNRLTSTAEALDRQATALALLTDRISERLTQGSAALTGQIDQLGAAGDRVANRLAATLETLPAQGDAITALDQRLIDSADSIRTALTGLRQDSADLLEQVMAAAGAIAGLRDAVTDSAGSLDRNAGDLTNRLEDVLTNLSERSDQVTHIARRSVEGVAEIIALLHRQTEQATQAGEAALTRLDAATDALPGQLAPLEGIADAVLSRIEAGTRALSDQGAQIRVDLSRLANDLLAMTGQLTEQTLAVADLGSAAERVERAMAQVGSATAHLPNHLAALEAASHNIGPALDRLQAELARQTISLGDLPTQARAVTDEVVASIETFRAKTAELVEIARAIREDGLTIPGVGDAAAGIDAGTAHDRFLLDAASIVGELESLASDMARPLLKLSDHEAGERRADRAIQARRLADGWGNQIALEVRLRHGEDRAFRRLIDGYIEQFERLFAEQARYGAPNALDAILLSSDLGRLYIHLARAIGRL